MANAFKGPGGFQTVQAGGYISLGLVMTKEKTKTLAVSLVRSEMTKNRDTVFAAEKAVYVLLLQLGYDDDWIRYELLPEFEKNLNQFVNNGR